MIDRNARNQFIDLLQSLLADRITLAQFNSKMIDVADQSSEIAIWTIYQQFAAKFFTVQVQKIDKPETLSDKAKSQAEIIILFLKSDLPYAWPDTPEIHPSDLPLMLAGGLILITTLLTIGLLFVAGLSKPTIISFLATVLSIILAAILRRFYTRKSSQLNNHYEIWKNYGDSEVWPFIACSDYEQSATQSNQ